MKTYLFESEFLSVAVLWEDGKAEEIVLNPYSRNSTNSDLPPVVERFFADVALYLAGSQDEFDVILLPLNEPYRPVANGAYSLAEDYSLTVEAFADMLSRLSTDGTLVMTRWLQTPPSEELRTLATLIEALDRVGINDRGSRLVAYRGIQTMTFLVQPGGWSGEQLKLVRDFTEQRRYDLVWAPDIELQEANRYNKLEQPIYYQHFSELLAAELPESYYQDYAYAIQPASDDRPFFFHFFKWQQTPQILATFGRVWQPFGGSGYFVLIALLLLVTVFSLILIVLPLLVRRRSKVQAKQALVNHSISQKSIPTWRVFFYFGSIGIAFLFLEIPLIQSSILSMEQPAYAFGFVVLILLLSSSLGSLYSRRFWNKKELVLFTLLGMAAGIRTMMRSAAEIQKTVLADEAKKKNDEKNEEG